MKIFIDAVGLRIGGGATVLLRFLEAATALDNTDVSWTVFVLPRDRRQFDLPSSIGPITVEECQHGDSWTERVVWTQITFPRLARERKADVVFCMANQGALRPLVPQVVLLHQALYVTPGAFKGFGWRDHAARSVAQQLALRGLRASNYAVTQTDAMARALSESAKIPLERIVTIPCGGPGPLFQSETRAPFSWNGSEPPRPRLLYVAFPTPYKNMETVLRGLSLLRDDLPSARLVLTMRPPDRLQGGSAYEMRMIREYQVEARALGVEDLIVWTGVLPQETTLALYRECEIFVCASLVESFPQPLVEAMALGRPMLLADLPYAREIAGLAALYFDPQDPNSFASQAKRLTLDPDLRADLAAKSLSRSALFSWKTNAIRTVEVLTDAAKSPTPRRVGAPERTGMRIFSNTWGNGYVDYNLLPGHCRIAVRRWHVLAPLEGVYIEPFVDWRRGLSYLREVGPSATLRKALSRYRERLRNEKFISFGLGEVIEGGPDSPFRTGQSVVFVAPAHPKCAERIVLPYELLKPVGDAGLLKGIEATSLYYSDEADSATLEGPWESLAGWNNFSGQTLQLQRMRLLLEEAEQRLREIPLEACSKLPLEPSNTPSDRLHSTSDKRGDALQAVVFGYGHHARTAMLPYLPRQIRLAKIHEIDPTLLGQKPPSVALDSSPEPRRGERFDVYLLAGYHHTHAPIAAYAMRNNASVIMEKPIATTFEQLDELLDAANTGNGKLFVAFQRRYSPLNSLVFQDLRTRSGDPISYNCVVYEIETPPLHWYRWPNAGSSLVSNGCHWIDHFLFLNDFSPATSYDVWEASNKDIFVVLELANGASFSLSLTHQGSPRIGVQEFVQITAGKRTVKVVNGSRYTAEDERHLVRRVTVNKWDSYKIQYRDIYRRIVAGLQGDDLQTIEVSARLVLHLEALLQSKRAGKGAVVPQRSLWDARP